jgi:HAUS augmin-like complex subunit 3
MSGARLCALLEELGFDGQDSSLDPDSFEWPFQYEEARPLLNWICSSLRPSNVLSLSELSQYASLFIFSLISIIISLFILHFSEIGVILNHIAEISPRILGISLKLCHSRCAFLMSKILQYLCL